MQDDAVHEAHEFLSGKLGFKPSVGIVLGSGLYGVAGLVGEPVAIPFAEIPHFPAPTVPGHPGKITVGRLDGVDAVVMEGRLHYYEGYSMGEVAFPISLMARLGVSILVETCAVGALIPGPMPGDAVLVSDHVNLMGDNPLIGRSAEGRFIDMNDAYSPRLRELMEQAAKEAGIALRQVVYAAMAGPSYETPAEAKFLAGLADVVGMSLVPEVIVARRWGIEVVALGVVTNTHVVPDTVTHRDVLEVAKKAEQKIEKLIKGFLNKIRSNTDEGEC